MNDKTTRDYPSQYISPEQIDVVMSDYIDVKRRLDKMNIIVEDTDEGVIWRRS